MRRRPLTATLATILLGCCAAQSHAQGPAPPRNFKLFIDDEVVNEVPQYFVRIEVNHPNHIYHEGDELVMKVLSEKTCYIHLIDIDPQGNAYCIRPNNRQPNNAVQANVEFEIRGPRVRAPFGEEYLCVIATENDDELFPGKNVKGNRVTPLTADDLKGVTTRLSKGGGSPGILKRFVDDANAAEHRIKVLTVAGANPDPSQVDPPLPDPNQSQRLAVCIGISDYQDPDIPDLRLSENDARSIAQVLRDNCGISQVQFLLGRDATLANIRQAIFVDMKNKTRPGDTIIIYFSGHGGKCADTDGDESAANGGDGMDEYLVPYDGVLAKPEQTMLIDDAFGRWLNELQGRKIFVILDNCYSGGQAEGTKRPVVEGQKPKGVKALPVPSPRMRPGIALKGGLGGRHGEDFLDEVNRIDRLRFKGGRAKDIGGAVVLMAASEPNQIAFEMPSDEGSVLTVFLTKALRSAPSRYTPEAAYGQIKTEVAEYVQRTFQTTQTPVLTGNSPGLLIRP
jgi:hypothetical protein